MSHQESEDANFEVLGIRASGCKERTRENMVLRRGSGDELGHEGMGMRPETVRQRMHICIYVLCTP